MTPLIPLPDPDPDAEENQTTHTEPEAPADPSASSAASRRGLRGRIGNRRRPKRRREPEIFTPAPPRFDREVPAGDVDESAVRTEWDHVDDQIGAAEIRLMLTNVAERILDLLPRQIATEDRLLAELKSVRRERTETEAELSDLRELLSEHSQGSDYERARLRRQHDSTSSKLARLERRERDIAFDLNRVSQHIEATPERVYRQAAIIIGHHWRDAQLRASEKPHLGGIWSPDDVSWTIETFERRYGKLPILTPEEIAQYVERLRETCRRHAEVL